jgi:hypothetical protein
MTDKTLYMIHPVTKQFVTAEHLVDIDMDYREGLPDDEPVDEYDIHVVVATQSVGWEVVKTQLDPSATRLFGRIQQFVDLLLEPESAESAIANLDELYRRRLAKNPGHAKRWLVAQVGWIVFGRAMELFGRFSAARAGK